MGRRTADGNGRGDAGKAARTDIQVTRWLAGATLVKPPPRPPTRQKRGGRHGARLAQRGSFSVRRDNPAGESSIVWGNNGGSKASRVAHKSSGVGDK